MSRHLVDPELATGLDTNMPAYKLDAETLPTYRRMLIDMVAAIPKPTSEATINVRRDERLVPGPTGSPDVRVLVYSPGDKGNAVFHFEAHAAFDALFHAVIPLTNVVSKVYCI